MDLAFRPPYMNPAVEEQVDNLSMEVDNIGRHQMGMQDGMEQLHDNQLALRDEQVHQENHLRDLGHHVGNVEHNQMTMVHHPGHVEQRQKDFERNQNHFNRDLYEKIEDLRDRITTSW
jgi:predicted  nucleic acid-binding Zn-ribbon protein